ncbi:hypothetical protein BC829DRAFT_398939 [Chytridium lagenaria]|nr:hypothetical protein BC829DRAFT_398939 [Chytridium lagenaria]
MRIPSKISRFAFEPFFVCVCCVCVSVCLFILTVLFALCIFYFSFLFFLLTGVLTEFQGSFVFYIEISRPPPTPQPRQKVKAQK